MNSHNELTTEGHMDSRVKVFGHSLHQMLIVFPLGLLLTSTAFDVLAFASQSPYWWNISYPMILSGVILGAVAGFVGIIDFLDIPSGTRAKSIGLVHGSCAIGVIILYGVSFVLRSMTPGVVEWKAMIPSSVGFFLALIAGWLGGELVDRLGIGVDAGAHPNAPSSLSHDSAFRTEPYENEDLARARINH